MNEKIWKKKKTLPWVSYIYIKFIKKILPKVRPQEHDAKRAREIEKQGAIQ